MAVTLSNQTIKAPNVYWGVGGSIYLSKGVKLDCNLIQEKGSLYVTGTSEITGDYYITSEDKSSYCSAKLFMNSADGHLVVYGDFVTDSSESHGSNLTNGTLEIKGDFTQRSSYYASDNFRTSGAHKVVFSGTGEQIISFEDPTYSCFNILINENPKDTVFATTYRYNQLQTIYPFDFEVVEYNAETNQINVDVCLNDDLKVLNGTVIISLYDESNKLIKCRIKELSVSESQTFDGLDDYTGNYIVKAFYWSDMNSIKPLCSSIQKKRYICM